MADNARKKEKQRLKRKQKQLAHRKAQNLSPIVKVGKIGGALECWVNEGWEAMGMADLMVLGHAGGGNYVFGVFLIDTWCVGLKDVWGRLNVSRQDFQERILDRANQTHTLVKFEVEEGRKLLAGALRFSRRNGFKLPPHYERWTAIFGNLGDIHSADISTFGINGKLRYVGTMDFLRQRLIASSAEEFISRRDVEYVMGVGSRGPVAGMPFEFEDLDLEFQDDEDEFDDAHGSLGPSHNTADESLTSPMGAIEGTVVKRENL